MWRMGRVGEEMRRVVQVQAEAFQLSVALFDDIFDFFSTSMTMRHRRRFTTGINGTRPCCRREAEVVAIWSDQRRTRQIAEWGPAAMFGLCRPLGWQGRCSPSRMPTLAWGSFSAEPRAPPWRSYANGDSRGDIEEIEWREVVHPHGAKVRTSDLR